MMESTTLPQSIEVILKKQKPHPVYQVRLIREGSSSDVKAFHRFADFVLLKDELLPEIHATYPPLKMPDFPKRYTKSSLGLKLSAKELSNRTAGIDAWMKVLVAAIDDMSPEAQASFRAFLGGRLTTVVAPWKVTAVEEDDAREVADIISTVPETLQGGGVAGRGADTAAAADVPVSSSAPLQGAKLSYFPLPGRGEPVRLALVLSGVEWSDCRVPSSSWGGGVEFEGGVVKASAPWGSLPVLELSDGTVLAQARATLRFVGKQAGLYPSEDSDGSGDSMMAALRCDELLDAIDDVQAKSNSVGQGMDKAGKEAARSEAAESGVIAAALAGIDAFIGVHGSGGHAVGSTMTVADLAVACLLPFLCCGFYDGIPQATLLRYHHIQATRRVVMTHEKVAEWYASRRAKDSSVSPYEVFVATPPSPTTTATVPVSSSAMASTTSAKPTIYYWNLKARAQLPVMLLTAGKVDFNWEKDPGDYKSFAPFGQLPVLKDGEVTIGQSMAVAHYCARLAKLEGEGADWATSEMMIEEHNDIFALFGKAKGLNSAEGWDACVKEDIPKHLAMLEGKLTASGFFGSALCAGDVAICNVINFAMDIGGLDMAPFPKLSALYASLCAGEGACASYIAEAPPHYFKRP